MFPSTTEGHTLVVEVEADWVQIKCDGLADAVVIAPARGVVTLKNIPDGECVARVPNGCSCEGTLDEAVVHLSWGGSSHSVGVPVSFGGPVPSWWIGDNVDLGGGCRFRAPDEPVFWGHSAVIHSPPLLHWRLELLDREYRMARLPR